MSQMIESFMNDAERPATRPVALEEMGLPPHRGASLLADASPLLALRVQLHVRVGTATLTVAELLAARENEVLALDRAVADPVDILLEDKVVARGELVAVDDAFAVRITDLPLPLKL